MRRILRTAAAAVAILAHVACENPVSPDDRAAGIETVSGDNQSGTVGSTLAEDVVVRVVDDVGAPVAGVRVNFAMAGMNGDVQRGDPPPHRVTPVDSSVLTGPDGLARTRVMLGTGAGELFLSARVAAAGVDSMGRPAIYTLVRARARPDVVASIVPYVSPPVLTGLPGEEFAIPIQARDRFGNHVWPVTFVLESADSTIVMPLLDNLGSSLVVRLIRAGTSSVSVRVGAVVWTLPVRAEAVDGVSLSPKLGTSFNPGIGSLTLAAGEPLAINQGRLMRLRAGQWAPVPGAPENPSYVKGAADGSIFVLAGPGTGGWKLWWTRDGSGWSSIDDAFGAVVVVGNGARPTMVSMQSGGVRVQQLGPDNGWQLIPPPPPLGDSIAVGASVAVAGPDDLWLSLTMRVVNNASRAAVWRRRNGAWSRVAVPLAVPGEALETLNESVALANGDRDGRVRALMVARRFVAAPPPSGFTTLATRLMTVENGELVYLTDRSTLSPTVTMGTDDRGWALLGAVLSDSVLVENAGGLSVHRLPQGKTVAGTPTGDGNAVWVPLSNGQLLRIARR